MYPTNSNNIKPQIYPYLGSLLFEWQLQTAVLTTSCHHFSYFAFSVFWWIWHLSCGFKAKDAWWPLAVICYFMHQQGSPVQRPSSRTTSSSLGRLRYRFNHRFAWAKPSKRLLSCGNWANVISCAWAMFSRTKTQSVPPCFWVLVAS